MQLSTDLSLETLKFVFISVYIECFAVVLENLLETNIYLRWVLIVGISTAIMHTNPN